MIVMTVGHGNPLRVEPWHLDFDAHESHVDDKQTPEQKERLAKFEVGDARQSRVLYSADHTTNGLDNYGSRHHFPKRENWDRSGPYLIVGGSDGSGTRAVVNQLMELGALMHFEDKRSLDVHGGEMFMKGT